MVRAHDEHALIVATDSKFHVDGVPSRILDSGFDTGGTSRLQLAFLDNVYSIAKNSHCS